MNNAEPQNQNEYIALFEAAFKPDLPADALEPARIDIKQGPGPLLDAMIENPAESRDWLGYLTDARLWDNWSGAAPLDFVQTSVLGMLLARNTKELTHRADTALSAGLLWYKSAVAINLAGTNTKLDIIKQAEAVLGGALRSVSSKRASLILAFAYSLQEIYEKNARTGIHRRHCEILCNVIWPQLSMLRPEQAFSLIMDSYAATGESAVLAAGFMQLLSSSSEKNIPYLSYALWPDMLAAIIDTIRGEVKPIADRAAMGLQQLTMAILANAEQKETSEHLELIHNVMGFINSSQI